MYLGYCQICRISNIVVLKYLKEEVDNGGASGSCHSNLECEVKKLKDQVGWLETVKLDLDDKVENLTAQVENLKSNNFSLSGENAQLQIKVQKLELVSLSLYIRKEISYEMGWQ